MVAAGLAVAMAAAKTLAAANGEDRGRKMGQLWELLTHDALDSSMAHIRRCRKIAGGEW